MALKCPYLLTELQVDNMVEMYKNLPVHLWKWWQPSSSMPVTWHKQNAVFPWVIRCTYHQYIFFFLLYSYN